MEDNLVKLQQTEFFSRNRAGCAFAAYAAKRPTKYGWATSVLAADAHQIDQTIRQAITDSSKEIVSLIFPSVTSATALLRLVDACLESELFYDEGVSDPVQRFIKLRVLVGDDVSWVSGFGAFEFLPKTRQAPHCELTIRVKPRPAYDWYFKESAAGVIHLADLDMRGLSERNLKKLWAASFDKTRSVLGHEPDDMSAAKTTFVVPPHLI